MTTLLLQLGFAVQIILQVGCSIQAYRIWKDINHGNRWWLLSGAFILMAARRVTAMMTANGTDMTVLQVADKLALPLTISVLLFLGLTFLNQSTEKFRDSNLKRIEELTKKLS